MQEARLPILYKIEIARRALEGLTAAERETLLGFGKLFNELNITTKCLT